LLMPQNQPVKPWSATSEICDANTSSDRAVPKSLSQLIHADATESTDPLPVPETSGVQGANHWMNHIFTDAAASSPQTAPSSEPTGSFFDLAPFLESGELSSEIVRSVEDTTPAVQSSSQMPDAATNQTPASQPLDSAQPEENLWDDLARLIDPMVSDLQTGTSAAPSLEIPQPEVAAVSQPTVDEPTQRSTESEQSGTLIRERNLRNLIPLGLQSERSRQKTEQQSSIPASEPAVPNRLAAFVAHGTDSPVDTAASEIISSTMTVPPSWPSPVVYPMRSSKKLKSLAAVELPTFPHQ